MKKLLFLLFLPLTLSAQYAVADFIVLNKGMDSQYHKLEKVWGAWHKNSINKEKKWLGCMKELLEEIMIMKMQHIM